MSIYGKRKFAEDARLDWLFPERQKVKTEDKKKKEALAQAKKELEEEEDGDEKSAAKKGAENGAANGKNGGGKASGNGGGGGGAGGNGSPTSVRPQLTSGFTHADPSSQNAARDAAMRASILLDKKNKVDVLGSMFQEGAMDLSQLPMHPCPPGKKDGTMKANLLPFQVHTAFSLRSRPARLTGYVSHAAPRARVDDQDGAPGAAQVGRRHAGPALEDAQGRRGALELSLEVVPTAS
ncbi:hypothetical protein JCM10449v2_004483 [Rhodotorula kratochvilovae]